MHGCSHLGLAACLGLSLSVIGCGGGSGLERGASSVGEREDDPPSPRDDDRPSSDRDARVESAADGGRTRDASVSTRSDGGAPPSEPDLDVADAPCDASKAPSIPKLGVRTVATGLSGLVYAAQPKGSGDWYLVQQTGQIRVLKAGESRPSATPFLDVSSQVRLLLPDDERGLLGLAFAPDYAQSGTFYVMMTPSSNADTVFEYKRSSDPYVAEQAPLRALLTLPSSAFNHNGGHLVFGPDQKLYVGTGDGGGTCNSDKPGAPQQPDALFGKLLRIEPKVGGRPEVVHTGLRNPYRFSFDRANGDLYIGDVGQDAFEELDFAPAGTQGLNFGWGAYEASAMTCGGRRLETGEPHTPPILGIDRRAAASGPFRDYKSIIGGHVYRGHAIPALRGTYVFGDFKGARMGALVQCGSQTSEVTPIAKNRDPNAPSAAAFTSVGGAPRIGDLTAIVTDDAGELYLVVNRSALLQVVPGP